MPPIFKAIAAVLHVILLVDVQLYYGKAAHFEAYISKVIEAGVKLRHRGCAQRRVIAVEERKEREKEKIPFLTPMATGSVCLNYLARV